MSQGLTTQREMSNKFFKLSETIAVLSGVATCSVDVDNSCKAPVVKVVVHETDDTLRHIDRMELASYSCPTDKQTKKATLKSIHHHTMELSQYWCHVITLSCASYQQSSSVLHRLQ